MATVHRVSGLVIDDDALDLVMPDEGALPASAPSLHLAIEAVEEGFAPDGVGSVDEGVKTMTDGFEFDEGCWVVCEAGEES